MSNKSEIAIECHGALSQLYGSHEFRVQLDTTQPRVATLMEALRQRCPEAAGLLNRSAVARGDSLVERNEQLTSGDHVALIPPVSGG